VIISTHINSQLHQKDFVTMDHGTLKDRVWYGDLKWSNKVEERDRLDGPKEKSVQLILSDSSRTGIRFENLEKLQDLIRKLENSI